MAKGHKDKVAVITGAAGGIGATTAVRFVEEGARVIALDRDAAALSCIFKRPRKRDRGRVRGRS